METSVTDTLRLAQRTYLNEPNRCHITDVTAPMRHSSARVFGHRLRAQTPSPSPEPLGGYSTRSPHQNVTLYNTEKLTSILHTSIGDNTAANLRRLDSVCKHACKGLKVHTPRHSDIMKAVSRESASNRVRRPWTYSCECPQ